MDAIKKVKFSDLDVKDSFFKSLIEDYSGFEDWFYRKSNDDAYVLETVSGLQGFLYLKDENEEDNLITPIFEKKRRLKIGTFKIDSHGTVLGQRFISIILRKMLEGNFEETYVTLFDRQEGLIKLFEKFGFSFWGNKDNGELVYVRNKLNNNDIYSNYPVIKTKNVGNYLLGIFPKYHTKLFPDSKLQTEKTHKIEDLSFTNTIEKIYLCKIRKIMDIKKNDLLLIYRTKENDKSAEYSSVATSICTVVETRNINSFRDCDDFMKYCGKGSIFTKDELKSFWKFKRYPYIIKMLYNFPLSKRITRNKLIEDVALDRDEYWGFFEIESKKFRKILEIGEVNESFVID